MKAELVFTLNLAELQRRAIDRALELTGNDYRRAAKLLGVGRSTLYRLRPRPRKPGTSRSALARAKQRERQLTFAPAGFGSELELARAPRVVVRAC